jgi:hypothetical protein
MPLAAPALASTARGLFTAEGSGSKGVYGSGSRYGGDFYAYDDSFSIGVNTSGDTYGLYSLSSSGTAGYFSSGTGYGLIVEKGNVGIGTTSPGSFKLAVNGSAAKPGGGSWSIFSDERLKTIHGTFDAGLEEVLKLQPISYRYNKDNPLNIPDEGEHIGFSAQVVQEVLPEDVSANSEGYLMVNNDPIMWTMLNAIKEQQEQIEELKDEVKNLKEVKAENVVLTREIKDIKEAIGL